MRGATVWRPQQAHWVMGAVGRADKGARILRVGWLVGRLHTCLCARLQYAPRVCGCVGVCPPTYLPTYCLYLQTVPSFRYVLRTYVPHFVAYALRTTYAYASLRSRTVIRVPCSCICIVAPTADVPPRSLARSAVLQAQVCSNLRIDVGRATLPYARVGSAPALPRMMFAVLLASAQWARLVVGAQTRHIATRRTTPRPGASYDSV